MSTTGGRSASAAPQSHLIRLTTGGRSASAAPQSHLIRLAQRGMAAFAASTMGRGDDRSPHAGL